MNHTISKILPAAFAGMLALSGQSSANSPTIGNSGAATPLAQEQTTRIADQGAKLSQSQDPMKQLFAAAGARLAQEVADDCKVPPSHGPYTRVRTIHILREVKEFTKLQGKTLDQYAKKQASIMLGPDAPLSDPNYQKRMRYAVSYLRVDQREMRQLDRAFKKAGVTNPKDRQVLIDYEIETSPYQIGRSPTRCSYIVNKQIEFKVDMRDFLSHKEGK